MGPKGAYRAFGRCLGSDRTSLHNGQEASDGWHGFQGGFRSDWDLSPRDTLTVQRELFETNERQSTTVVFSNALPLQRTITDRITVEAGHVLGRWNRTLENGSDMSLQVYYDRDHRVDGGLDASQNTVDLDFHHRLAVGRRHEIVWGLGVRVTHDHFVPGFSTTFLPPRRSDSLFSAFVQDEISVTPSLSLTL